MTPTDGRWVVAAVVLAVALAAGLIGAVVARRRLERLLGTHVNQQYRVLRPVAARTRVNTVYWAAVILALGWLEVSGRFVLGGSVVLGVAALCLLPGALVALAVARRIGPPDTSASDVWWIATRGRIPAIDKPVPALRPLAGPVPEGLVAPPRLPDPPHPALP